MLWTERERGHLGSVISGVGVNWTFWPGGGINHYFECSSQPIPRCIYVGWDLFMFRQPQSTEVLGLYSLNNRKIYSDT